MTSGKYCEQSSESNAKTFLWGNSEDGAIRRKGQDGIAGSSRKYRRRDRRAQIDNTILLFAEIGLGPFSGYIFSIIVSVNDRQKTRLCIHSQE